MDKIIVFYIVVVILVVILIVLAFMIFAYKRDKFELQKDLIQTSGELISLKKREIELEHETSELRQEIGVANERAKGYAQQGEFWRESLSERESEIRALNSDKNALLQELSALKSTLNERQKSEIERERNFTETQKSLSIQFENLANKIFDEKTSAFNKFNQNSIELLLKPLREQIISFQNRVNEVHSESLKSGASLSEQIKNVLNVGLSMSNEAKNLTTALKGSNKIAGNWGEAQLERTLQAAGLVKDEHYFTQQRFKDDNGLYLVPDFVVAMPDNKCVIIDSKVSLVAYSEVIEAVNVGSEALLQSAMKSHINSIKAHIDGLSRKDYASIMDGRSPDFVLMFMPIEPAFIEAMKFDATLFNYGYERRVVLVSHTTLMPILRTIANLWRIEQGNAKALEIATRAADIYNKVIAVGEALLKLGGTLNTASNHYNQVITSLVGRQGLVGRVEKFRQISNKAIQNMPELNEINTHFETEKLENLIEKNTDDKSLGDKRL
ncbi:DNA recombination protein RmuC [Campylobacter anatolicus]|nr:DNA recombination protein RmuC [Campylobacter anatolicus]